MKKLNQISFFNIKYTGVFFKRFNASWERMYVFLWKIITVVRYFLVWDNFEKKLLKSLQIFLSSEIHFSASLRIICPSFDAFFVKRGTTVRRKFLLSVNSFVLRLSKYNFLVFLYNFLQVSLNFIISPVCLTFSF